MKTLIKPRCTIKKYPKHKIKWCSSCRALLYTTFEDCELGETVLGIPAFYVRCPHCGDFLHYCKQ